MKRAVLMSAASAFCLLWATGCSTTGKLDAKQPVASAAVEKPADENPSASSDIATLAKNMPATMEGEIKRAKLLREKGDYPEAEHSLAQLMLIAPDDGIVVGEYGKVLEQEGRSDEALAFLTRAVALQPRDWTLFSALGIAYDQLDKRENARTAYERALALKPGEASVLNNYAVSRMLAGDYAGAQRLLAEATAHGATDPKIAMNAEKLASMSPPPPAPVAVQAAPPPPKPVPPPAIKVAVLPSATVQAAAVKPVATQAPKPMTLAPAAPAHSPIAVISLKTSPPTVVMQRVPFDPLATKSANAHPVSAAGAIVSLHPVATHAPLAIVAARSLGPNVVMQRVPFDPLAGPVAARKPAHKPAVAAAKPVDDTPSLRTAADTGN